MKHTNWALRLALLFLVLACATSSLHISYAKYAETILEAKTFNFCIGGPPWSDSISTARASTNGGTTGTFTNLPAGYYAIYVRGGAGATGQANNSQRGGNGGAAGQVAAVVYFAGGTVNYTLGAHWGGGNGAGNGRAGGGMTFLGTGGTGSAWNATTVLGCAGGGGGGGGATSNNVLRGLDGGYGGQLVWGVGSGIGHQGEGISGNYNGTLNNLSAGGESTATNAGGGGGASGTTGGSGNANGANGPGANGGTATSWGGGGGAGWAGGGGGGATNGYNPDGAGGGGSSAVATTYAVPTAKPYLLAKQYIDSNYVNKGTTPVVVMIYLGASYPYNGTP